MTYLYTYIYIYIYIYTLERFKSVLCSSHSPSLPLQEKSPSEELQPADVEKMLKNVIPFDGLRLDGDNIHRGQGNFKISKYVAILFVTVNIVNK